MAVAELPPVAISSPSCPADVWICCSSNSQKTPRVFVGHGHGIESNSAADRLRVGKKRRESHFAFVALRLECFPKRAHLAIDLGKTKAFGRTDALVAILPTPFLSVTSDRARTTP
jgi:hypothetical protein